MGKKVVLDTDVLIEIFERGNKEVAQKVKELSKDHIISTTIINAIELLWGSENSKETLEILESMEVLGLDDKISKFVGVVANKLRKKGKTPSFADCVIAGICIMNGAMLYTLNKKDFERFEDLGLILVE